MTNEYGISDFDMLTVNSKKNITNDERIIGYCRISNPSQNIERQVRNIKQLYPNCTIIQETYTGTRLDRPQWEKIMRQVKNGKVDVIVFD